MIYEEPPIMPVFNPCISCGKRKVLKLGDYCQQCGSIADLPASKYEYYIVSPATMDVAAEKSGITREFLNAKMGRAFENYQNYIIFNNDGKWEDILVAEWFYVPAVMKALYKRLEG